MHAVGEGVAEGWDGRKRFKGGRGFAAAFTQQLGKLGCSPEVANLRS